MELVLVRHGESEANLAGLIQGQGDYDLSEGGRKQAWRTAEALADFRPGVVFVSPLKRARTTAEIINSAHEVEIIELADLMEYNLGAFEGLTFEQVFEKFPHVLPALKEGTPFHLLAPGGEKDAEADVRALRAIDNITSCGQPRVLVVSHLGMLERMVLKLLENFNPGRALDWPLKNCSITRLQLHPLGNTLVEFNRVGHLEESSQ